MDRTIDRLVKMVAFASVLVVQDVALSFIPNVQLTVLLIFVLARRFTVRESLAVLFVYVLVDNMIYGGIGLYTIPMYAGWVFVLFLGHGKMVYSALAGAVYSFPFVVFNVLVFDVDLWAYLAADFPFVVVMSWSSLMSCVLLYERILRVV